MKLALKWVTFTLCLSILSISCKKKSSNLDNCDAYAVQKMEAEGYVKIKSIEESPNSYTSLCRGYYNQQVVYFESTFCGLACEALPHYFNCEGETINMNGSVIEGFQCDQSLGYFATQPKQ